MGALTWALGPAFLVLAIGVGMGMSALTGQLMRLDPSVFDPGFRLTGAWLERWAWLSLGTGLLVHQYSTRRTLRTVLIGALALPLAFFSARYRYPFKGVFNALILVPLILPPFVGASGMRAMPAGSEISVRTVGTSRPTRTAIRPWRSNQRIAWPISFSPSVSQRP